MLIASIDQSFTHTAICIFDYDTKSLLDFTVIKTKKIKKETPFELRIINIIEELFIFLEKYPIGHIVLEGLSMNRNSIMARPLAGLYYSLCIEFYRRNIPYTNVPPTSVKKFAIKGNAKKEEMYEVLPIDIKEVFLTSGYKKTTGLLDLTDSYFIGQFYLNTTI
jgi:Holliday junction resolvasome RuvABC endonuclease subunit